MWLEEAGNSWELLAASGTGMKSKGGVTQVHHSFYNDGEETDSSKDSKPCFKCGESGHWKRDCPKTSPGRNGKSTGGGKHAQTKVVKDRPALKYKKFYCAFHKGASGRACSTWSCAAMKYTPYDERMKILKANGDCVAETVRKETAYQKTSVPVEEERMGEAAVLVIWGTSCSARELSYVSAHSSRQCSERKTIAAMEFYFKL